MSPKSDPAVPIAMAGLELKESAGTRSCNCSQRCPGQQMPRSGRIPPAPTVAPTRGAAAPPKRWGHSRAGGRRPPLTFHHHHLQADHLGAVAEQDALVLSLVPGLGTIQPQRGAAARGLLLVLREGCGGPEPAHRGVPGTLRAALDAQGPAPHPGGRQRPDLQAAGRHCPHRWPCPCRARAGDCSGGHTCCAGACNEVLGHSGLCGGGVGDNSQIQGGPSVGLPCCGGITCRDARPWGKC